MMHRRQMISQAGLAALGLSLTGRVPHALSQELVRARNPHFFVFFEMPGAWDVCLAFEPKDRQVRMPNDEQQFDQPYDMKEVRDFHNVRLAPVGQTLSRYADRMTIINGIDMKLDAGHTVDQMMSGSTNARASGAPYVQAMLAKKHPFLNRLPIPHLYADYNAFQFFGGRYSAASITASLQDFLPLLGSDGGKPEVTNTIEALNEQYAQALPTSAARKIFDNYRHADRAVVGLQARMREGQVPMPTDFEDFTALGRSVGQVFALNILGSLTFNFDRLNFDTHFNHYAQHPLQTALERVDRFCQSLQNTAYDDHSTVLEHTTVVLTSEFTRTARLNGANGKDHNIHSNSLVLFGKGMSSAIYGASHWRQREDQSYEPHAGLDIDFATGKPKEDGQRLHCENIWASDFLGADLKDEFPNVNPIEFLRRT